MNFSSIVVLILYSVNFALFLILEALVLWMVEQCQIFVFGGTATSSMSKSFTNIIASVLSLMGLLYLSSIDKSIDEQSENGTYLLDIKTIQPNICTNLAIVS